MRCCTKSSIKFQKRKTRKEEYYQIKWRKSFSRNRGENHGWQSIVNKSVRSLKLESGGNRRNQSRKTDYVSRFETRHDTTWSFDPRGKISAHTEEGKERRREGDEEDAHDGMRAFRLCLCASAKWSVYTRFPPLLLRCSTASRIVGHAAKSLGSAILYQRGRAQIDCQPYRLSHSSFLQNYLQITFLIVQ